MKYIVLILIGILASCSLSTFEQQREQINTIIIHYDILLNSIENTYVRGIGVGITEAAVANPFMNIRNQCNKSLEMGEKFKINNYLKNNNLKSYIIIHRCPSHYDPPIKSNT